MARIHVLAHDADRQGGANVYTVELVTRLARAGHDVTLLCYAASGLPEGVCTVCQLHRPGVRLLPVLWRLSPALEYLSASAKVRALKLAAPDVVIVCNELFAPAHLRKYPGASVVYLPHPLISSAEVKDYRWGSPLQRWSATWIYSRLERWLLNRAERTLRFTRFGCRALQEYCGPSVRPRFAVFPPPVELPPPGPEREPSGDGLRLLFLGRLVPSKNASFLLRTLRGLTDLAWSLDVVGDGLERPRLEAEARDLGLEGRVTFHGQQNDVERFYRRADLFVFPSKLESFGLVLIEAMSHGLPALCVRSDGRSYVNPFDELIAHGEDGFLAEGEEDFARLLREFLRDPAPLARVGRNARLAAGQRNTWSEHMRHYESMFAELLQPGPQQAGTALVGERQGGGDLRVHSSTLNE
jgi:glycosyltransferase involved in cell wall biosynthesis